MIDMRKRTLFYTIIVAVVLLLVTACGDSGEKSSDHASSMPTAGGVLKFADGSEVRSLDPVDISIYFTSGGDRAISIYGSLMKYGDEGKVIPAMAKSFTTDDGLTWMLKLRKGVKFTDGTKYDAKAVKFNLKRHMAPDSNSTGKSLLDDVKSMTVADPYTLKFELNEKNGAFDSLFTQGSNLGFIASPTAMKKKGDKFGSDPVGAGPFVFEEWVRDDHLTVVRNDGYWDKGKPYVDKIEYSIIPDPQTKAQSLISGQINAALILPPDAWVSLKDNDQFHIYKEGTSGAAALFPNAQRGPAKDDRVRKAMQMAFDPAATHKIFNKNVTEWDGNRDCLPFAENGPECTTNAPEYDMDKAKSLISDYKADGNSVKMEILTVSSNDLMDHAKYYQQVLNSIGLDVSINGVEVTEYTPGVIKGNYDAVASMILPFPNPYPKVFNFFDQSGSNYPKQKDKELDAALEKARDSLSDEKKAAAWKSALSIMNDKGYAIWAAPAPTYTVTSKDVHLGNAFVAGGSIWYPADAWIN